jgi:tripartite-type tricarboxylate transporter receptor subunit TctC
MKRVLSPLIVIAIAIFLAIPTLSSLFPGLAEAGQARSSFPEKGRPITMLVPWSAGGSLDVSARLLASDMEKMFGTPVMVVNKPGASGQVGTTQLALAKPDGYTFGVTAIPSTSTIYLDPDRKAAFSRKDLAPVARHVSDPMTIAVRADSKYQTLQDLIADAKANPDRIKVGSVGILSAMHLGLLMFQKATDTKLAAVQFDGSAQVAMALLGGHVDVMVDVIAVNVPHIKAGKIRLLGVMDREPIRKFPEMKT